MNTWWTAWLCQSLGYVVFALVSPNGDPNALFFVIADCAATILAIGVIQQLTNAQRALLAPQSDQAS